MAHVPGGTGYSSTAIPALNVDLAKLTTVGARPTLATDGVDITAWAVYGPVPGTAVLFLGGTVPCTVSAPTGSGNVNGVELYGYSAGLARWTWIPYLHNGADIPIFSSAQSWSQEVESLDLFSRLAVAGTVSAGVVTATFEPLRRSL